MSNTKPPRDLTDEIYGRLAVVGPASRVVTADRPKGIVAWACQCECYRFVVVPAKYLLNGNTRSCGCNKKPPKLTERRS